MAVRRTDIETYSDEVQVYRIDNVDAGAEVKTVAELCERIPTEHHLVFLQTPPGCQSANEIRRILTDAVGIPCDFWADVYQKANGYFGATAVHDANGELTELNTELRFLCKQHDKISMTSNDDGAGIGYAWEKLSFFTSWQKAGGYLMLCFDFGAAAKEAMLATFKAHRRKHGIGPFMYHDLAISVATSRFDHAVWSWRDQIRELEQRRPDQQIEKQTSINYKRMHELSRHATHSTESLSTAISTVTAVQESMQCQEKATSSSQSWSSINVGHGLIKQISILTSIHNRSKALEDRLTSEIGLAFHINGQWDSQLAAKIASLSKEDSEITKTIAILGMLFLPGTLISAIFSTSFFNYTPPTADSPGRWTVSDSFWIYWVITGAVTLVTIFIWTVWRQWHAVLRLMDRLMLRTSTRRSVNMRESGTQLSNLSRRADHRLLP